MVSDAQAPQGTNQYFDVSPTSKDDTRVIPVRLDGRDVEVMTSAGVFSPGHIDTGTSVLLRTVGAPPSGTVVDVGCGWGPIALTMAMRNPDAQVWAVDVNERSVALTARNAQRLDLHCINAVLASDIPEDFVVDELWSNPPIRIGKEALHALITQWLVRLRPGGRAVWVVQRHLGADSLMRWMNAQFAGEDRVTPGRYVTTKRASAKGFRVLETVHVAEQVARPDH
ncbi:class I SAM-dependent methyltransferase [Jonesia denitrificans]|uniref:Methyltransferase small n=1 Tax=Jonesia denitrificans (strain ATCC 14870 / DSM 20603 / BCRC 15368 / CIP 55.134 / JCM 11481 / NBRC 15587 / NCTC 10816 / Prevot 55134) TaxID=471856 RepID=C7R3H0_JONDD|nr:methyltransferase small [Jonesia denitrificans DSM 20603]ASE09962.1 methyltransferase domain-containing protein [Jonesia denitrificans]QXB42298.1 methyltransferase [Jonesia denitrificans]SQH20695.1 Ribosomal RNA large subunit methyltransferase G [Jonesia denitrificans]